MGFLSHAGSSKLTLLLAAVAAVAATGAMLWDPRPGPEAAVEAGFAQMLAGEVPGAVSSFTEAVRQEPAWAQHWCSLAEALLERGDRPKAAFCMRQAAAWAPCTPAVLLRAANFCFRVEEPRAAATYMRSVLLRTEAYDEVIFDSFARMGLRVDAVLRDGIPPVERASRAYFRYQLRIGNMADADQVWSWLTERQLGDDVLAGEYVSALIAKHGYEKAADVWGTYAGNQKEGYIGSNRVFNPEFEGPIRGIGFDWRLQEAEGVRVTQDSARPLSGHCSLRLDFDTTNNLDYRGLSQLVVLTPGTYRFRAFLRTDAVTTDQGVGFELQELDTPGQINVETPHLTGTQDWRRLETNFVVAARTRLILLQLTRHPSQKFDNRIKGRVWLDKVEVIRQ